jgi:predicted 3-demethylubiquinone-9 3-methyltransferase (glyoxalase superfamily)
MQDIATFLMFTGKAEEAINLYVTLFPDSKIISIERYGDGESGKAGSVKHAAFLINGVEFMAIDSEDIHGFTFTPAMSLFVKCKTDEEISTLYDRLSQDGQILMPLDQYPFSKKFGWIADKFGVSWQLSLPLDFSMNS